MLFKFVSNPARILLPFIGPDIELPSKLFFYVTLTNSYTQYSLLHRFYHSCKVFASGYCIKLLPKLIFLLPKIFTHPGAYNSMFTMPTYITISFFISNDV